LFSRIVGEIGPDSYECLVFIGNAILKPVLREDEEFFGFDEKK
jgi:hypothetical protein